MTAPILVTGATGNVGSEVLRLLHNYGQPVRAAVTSPDAAESLTQNGIEVVTLDFMQPATYGAALEGVSKLFLMRPPRLSDTKRYINPFIDAAREAGVQQIVFVSLLGAEKNPVVPHYAIEQHLKAVGVPWTFLRPSFFMQNLSTTHRVDIQQHDEVFVPAGRGTTSFIDVRDIAAVAAKVLTETGHAYRAYPLTGDEALGYSEVAQIFSAEFGRPIEYPRPSISAFVRRMRRYGHDWSYILVMVGIYTTARLGMAATVTPDTARLLGRAPITMRQFVHDYADCWS